MKHLFSIIFKSSSVRRLLLASSLLASIAFVGKLTLAQTSGLNTFPDSGNVGIGTTIPGVKLDLSQAASGNQIRFGTTGGSGAGRQWTLSAWNSPNSFSIDESGVERRLTILPGGNVGIGTLNPGRTLEVAGNVGIKVNADTGGNAQITFAQGGTDKAYLTYWNTSGTLALTSGVGTDGIHFNPTTKNVGIGTTDPGVYRLKVSGNSYFDGSVESSGNLAAKYQDVAEWVDASEPLEAGTIVVAHPTQTNTVQASYRAYDTTVLGAVSGQPGLLLGEAGEGKVKVSAHGRVRVKVTAENGTIRIGDLLVTSATAGHAMRMGSEHRPGAILGKALEPLASGTGEILVLLTLQ